MMRNALKRLLPQPVKAWVRRVLARPSVYYGRKALQTYREWLFKSYKPKYLANKADLMKDFAMHESLFESSTENFKEIVAPYVSEFRWSLGRLYNGAFVSIDPELYYSMIRRYRPNLIIEIGAGNSTHFATDAIRKNHSGRIISIDPEPRRALPESVDHILAKVEDVSLDLFSELKGNDILFIDSSHTTAEARYHCEHILPRLDKGVVIHHHDFTFPYEIYYGDDPVEFGEPDVLLEFYAANRDKFEALVCASYVRYREPELVNRLIKSYKWNPLRIPGSLWVRKQS